VRAAAVAIVGALAATGLLLFAGGGSSAPATQTPPQQPACVPLSAGTHRLPAIDGRVPVVLHVGRGGVCLAPIGDLGRQLAHERELRQIGVDGMRHAHRRVPAVPRGKAEIR